MYYNKRSVFYMVEISEELWFGEVVLNVGYLKEMVGFY